MFEFNRLTFKYFDKPNLFNLSDLPCFKNESRENEYCKHGKRNISLNAARGINFSTLLHLLQDKLLLFFTSGHLCNVEVFYLSKYATMSITIN